MTGPAPLAVRCVVAAHVRSRPGKPPPGGGCHLSLARPREKHARSPNRGSQPNPVRPQVRRGDPLNLHDAKRGRRADLNGEPTDCESARWSAHTGPAVDRLASAAVRPHARYQALGTGAGGSRCGRALDPRRARVHPRHRRVLHARVAAGTDSLHLNRSKLTLAHVSVILPDVGALHLRLAGRDEQEREKGATSPGECSLHWRSPHTWELQDR